MTKQVQDIFSRKSCEMKNVKDYVFTRILYTRLNEGYVSKKFMKLVRLSGLNTKVHFHTLRHSFASRLIQKGASVFVVKELLGMKI